MQDIVRRTLASQIHTNRAAATDESMSYTVVSRVDARLRDDHLSFFAAPAVDHVEAAIQRVRVRGARRHDPISVTARIEAVIFGRDRSAVRDVRGRRRGHGYYWARHERRDERRRDRLRADGLMGRRLRLRRRYRVPADFVCKAFGLSG